MSDPRIPDDDTDDTATQEPEERPGRDWADDAADARTSDDPRARAPHDALGIPSNRPFDE